MKATTFAIVLVASCALWKPAAAQNVYKCGDGYSQQPCPGGKSLPVDDARSDAQRKQAGTAAARDARLADTLEKDRLKQEAQPATSYVPPPQFAPAPDTRPQATPKLRKPEVFTAVAPGDKARKPTKAGKSQKAKKPKAAEKPAAAR
jgi:hypothetical protein